jgi:4-hydroxy-3-polyprenylbenzoate decarboxylase
MTNTNETQPIDEGNLPRPYNNVRDWLNLVETIGELKRISGAHWNLEIGTIAELIYRERAGAIPARV